MMCFKYRFLIFNYVCLKQVVYLSLFLLPLSYALYEDQIGKFDWRQQYIGKVKFSHIDPTVAGTNRFIVATEKNVLACLSTRTGSIIWRQVLEKGPTGQIDALSTEDDIISVNGNGQFIRSWDSVSGVLQWETPFPHVQWNSNATMQFSVNADKMEVSLVEMHSKSHAKIFIYSITQASVRSSDVINTPWFDQNTDCGYVTSSYFLCLDKVRRVFYLLPIRDNGLFISIPLRNFGIEISENLQSFSLVDVPYQSSSENPYFAIQLDNEAVLFQIQPPGVKLVRILPSVYSLTSTTLDSKLVLFMTSRNAGNYKVSAFYPKESSEISSLSGSFKLPVHHGEPEKVFVLPYVRKDQGTSYKLLISSNDHAISIVHQQGRLVWSREESLAEIVSTAILDLPLSETDATIEQEFSDGEVSIAGMLMTRLRSQIHQLETFLFQSIPGLHTLQTDSEVETDVVLMRDTFGLHKVIVAVTSPGKIFGIDNLSGHIVWSHYEKELVPFMLQGSQHLPFFIQRTTAHFPYPPQCTVLGRHKNSKNTHLYSFDPITGRSLDSVVLPYTVVQAVPLGIPDNHYLRAVVLLDSDLSVHVYPESSVHLLKELKDVHFIFTADSNDGTLTGYSLGFSHGEDFLATEAWKVKFPQPIIHIASKRPLEHVHSQGRVMGDRSVLYKYLNPNLAAVFTEGSDPILKSFFTVYLIDTVTGLVIYSASHKRCKSPIKVVHSENWVVYSYYNEKSRRVEISSIELFEGKSQSNTTAFSSFAPPPLPLIEHQTFIFPSAIETIMDTVTDRGMTSKHLLIALPTGGILELPKTFLDPRRPINPLPEHREEGLIPYIPELPIMAEGIINYNQSVMHINGIHTASSALESTCLVFAYGLDLFYTRVTPSKTFDILKDDFDHFLISAVLLALLVLSYTTKRLAARKSLRAAWK